MNNVAAETGLSSPTLTRIANIAGYNTNTDTIDAPCKYFACEPSDLLHFLPGE